MSGGVIPNGPDGITKGPLQEATAVTADAGGTGIPGLASLDQTAAENILKSIFVQGNASLDGVAELIFAGLRSGISLPLAIVESVAKKLLGLPDGFMFFNIDHALSELKKVPGLSDLAEALTGVEDGDLEDLGTWFLNLRNFLGTLDFTNPDFDPVSAAVTFATLILKPTGILAWLDPVSGILPNELAPQVLLDIMTAIGNAFNMIPFFGPVIAKPIFDAIRGLLSIGQSNSTQIGAIQNQLYSDPVAGGVSVSDTFDYPVAASLPSSLYNVTPIGVGAGTVGPDGSGALVFKSGGGSAVKEIRNRHKTAMATSTQSVSCVVLTPFSSISQGAQSKVHVRLQARMNAAETTYVECNIDYDYFLQPYINLRYLIGGVAQNIGTFVGTWANDPSTTWEYKVGHVDNARRHRVYRNNVLIVDTTESGAGSVIDNANNLFAAVSVCTGQDNGGGQIAPPDIGLFAFSDRNPNT